MSIAIPYVPPAKPGEQWNRLYPRSWWTANQGKPSQAALNRAYELLLHDEEVVNELPDAVHAYAD